VFDYRINILDLFIAFLTYIVLLSAAYIIMQRNIERKPHYRFFMIGFHAKILGGLIFAMIYAIYYNGGGDSIAYWLGGERLKNLFFKSPGDFFDELAGNQSWVSYFNHFTADTGYPPDWLYRSPRHFFVCRVTSIICFFIPKSFFGVTFFYSFLSYLGAWRLYEVYIRNFPSLEKSFRWAVLLIPSTLFWCSGVMKDTIVYTCICYIIYFTDRQFSSVEKRSRLKFILRLAINMFLIYSVKPYVLIALFPGWLLWINYQAIQRIRSRVLKYYLLPFVVTGTIFFAARIYMSTSGGEFAADAIVEKAMITRNDFAYNATYGSNRYEVEKVENTTAGLISSIPSALMAGLFRPYIWEARSPVVFLSGLENLWIMSLLLYALWRLKIIGVFRLVGSHPLLLYSFVFTIILAFFVGFTTVIFGALVRFRTPMLPFFIGFLVISINRIKILREEKAVRKKVQTSS